MRKPLPQVCSETGISEDYWNAWSFGVTQLCFPSGEKKLLDSLKNHPIRKYTEQFPPSEWEVDTRNFRVGALDRLADYVNKLSADNQLDAPAYIRTAKIVYYFVHGCRDHSADTTFDSIEAIVR